MKLGRRALLKATVGTAQLALLDRLARAPHARAQSGRDGPSKLLTIFMPGGWMSPYAFCGLSDDQIPLVTPAPYLDAANEPVFYNAAQVGNLDGSSGAGGHGSPVRMPRLWDQASLSAGLPDGRNGTTSHGWSWVQHRLWENTAIVHGVDQMTVAHQAGSVSAMCGVASSEFKSPAMQAWAAHALSERYPDRPVPSVWIGGPQPQPLQLSQGAHRITQFYDAQLLFSRRRERAWHDLRSENLASAETARLFDDTTVPGTLTLTPLEERSLRRMRSMRGNLNQASQHVLEQLHNGMLDVSAVLARDITTILEATVGFEHTPIPYWAPAGSTSRLSIDAGIHGMDAGASWEGRFDLALRLLKSDLATSVALDCNGPNYLNFDTHAQGHAFQFAAVRSSLEIIGRFLGEMKATPGSIPGQTLLDDTLVVLISDFARTWPGSTPPTSDHWAANSAILIGGGITPNQMLGGYGTAGNDPLAVGFDGIPIEIREASGVKMRPPRSSDVIHTALSILGVENVRIPGTSGEIVGVRRA
jgi:hypothetical protein